MDVALAPPELPWRPVSRRLFALRRLILLLFCGPAVAVGIALAAVFAPWWAAVLVAVVPAAAVAAVLRALSRNQRSWRYAERDDDLLIAHGVLFRRLVVVPYGRMQFVDVSAGPLERRFGMATLRLHTASPGTDAVVRGLPPEEAARLRDRLAELGEARSAGL